MGQDGLVFDDVGWWRGFKNGGDSIYDIYIGLCEIVEVMGINNYVSLSHGAPIGSSIIVADGGSIP